MNAAREALAAAKQRRVKEAHAVLQALGYAVTRSQARHFVVRHDGRCFDFWPGVGRWRERANHHAPGSFSIADLHRGIGLKSLLDHIDPHGPRCDCRAPGGYPHEPDCIYLLIE